MIKCHFISQIWAEPSEIIGDIYGNFQQSKQSVISFCLYNRQFLLPLCRRVFCFFIFAFDFQRVVFHKLYGTSYKRRVSLESMTQNIRSLIPTTYRKLFMKQNTVYNLTIHASICFFLSG